MASKKNSRNATSALNKRSSIKAASKKGAKTIAGIVKNLNGHSIKINYIETVYKFSAVRTSDRIHRRKNVPKAARGPKVADLLPTAPLSFEQDIPERALAESRSALATPTDTISLVKNIQLNDLATADTASHVCEPSAAVNGNVIFYTGNWFAAVSLDGGTNFSYVDPFKTFPDPRGMDFCCDQVVQYIKKIDMFVWLLQYSEDRFGKNIQRIAYATTTNVRKGAWRFFDITPASLGLAKHIWLDFPDLATSKNKLYLTTNCFQGNDWVKTAVVRIDLKSFKTNTLTASKLLLDDFSVRVAQHCDTIAYFAAHQTTSSLRVYSWKETDATPTFADVTVASWSERGYRSKTPDGKDWLHRADGRLTGAALCGSEVWFAWGSAAGGANNRPHPFVQIARINLATMTLVENINLWDPAFAICYASLSANINNEIGAAFTVGGGTRFPTQVVGILTNTRRQVTTFASVRGPADNKWGDYLSVRRNYPNDLLFLATGYSLQSGSGASDATPHFTVFGRTSDL